MSRWREVALRVGLALAFFAAYAGLVRPAREALALHVAFPALAAVDTPRAASFEVQPSARPPSVRVAPVAGGEAVVYQVPAGFYWLVPALVLIVVAPRRLYWLYLGGILLALGGADLVLVAVGVGWGDWGFTLHRFVTLYVVPPVSLAAPVLFLLDRLSPGFQLVPGEGHTASK